MVKGKLRRLLLILYTSVIGCLGLASVLEKTQGTAYVSEHVYGAWWFSALWASLTAVACAYIFKQHLYKRAALMLLHMALVIILAGALVTHVFGRQGTVRLRRGLTEITYINKAGKVERFPFSLTLKEFHTVNYPGTDNPLDYQCAIEQRYFKHQAALPSAQKVDVSMNHIGYVDGYRLIMRGCNADDESVVLSVNHDPYGIAITYVGYLMLLMGIIATLLSSKTQMRELYRKAMKPIAIVMFLLTPLTIHAEGFSHGEEWVPTTRTELSVSAMSGGRVSTTCKTNAGIFFNTLRSQKWPVMLALTFSLMLCILSMKANNHPSLFRACFFLLASVLVSYVTLQLGLRWWLSGHVPLSNGPETMLFMAWVLLLLSTLLHRRAPIATAFGPMASSLCLLVAMLGDNSSRLEPLTPLLRSPLLAVHVMTVMCAYALFALQVVLGVEASILAKRLANDESSPSSATAEGSDPSALELERITALSRLMLYPAVFLLAIGIFLGAVWANISWGNYWSWDPKETWALITLMVYAIPLHTTFIPALRKPLCYHLYMIIAFLTVLITYFGVNYLLGGMHSYA